MLDLLQSVLGPIFIIEMSCIPIVHNSFTTDNVNFLFSCIMASISYIIWSQNSSPKKDSLAQKGMLIVIATLAVVC